MEMKTLIATCSPYCNLIEVTSVLQKAGLKQENDNFRQWHDGLFQSAGLVEEFGQEDQLALELKAKETSDLILPEGLQSPLLMADSRCLWLLDFWAAKLPEAKFLLFFISAESALVHACQQGIDPQKVLDHWQSASLQLLNFQRRHRRSALLLDVEAAIRQPQTLIDICQGIGLTLQPLSQTVVPEPDIATLEYYIAKSIVERQPEISAMQTELEASAHPIEEMPFSELEPLALFREQSLRLVDQFNLKQNFDETVIKLKNAEQTIRELTGQNQGQKSQINQLIKANDEQTKLSAERQSRIETLQLVNAEAKKAADESLKENELLLLQLHQVQEELEKIFLEKQDLEQQKQKVQASLQQLKTQVGDLTKAHVEQVKLNTESQGKIKTLQRLNDESRNAADESLKENELLLLQLHQVQEKLEKAVQQNQDLSQQKQKDQVELQQLEARIGQLTKASDEQTKSIAESQSKIKTLQQLNDETKKAADEFSQENELLLLQLHQVQEELEKIFLEKQDLEQQKQKDQTEHRQIKARMEQLTKDRDLQKRITTDSHKKIQELKQHNKEVTAAAEMASEENERLLLQIVQLQKELDKAILQIHPKEQPMQQLEEKNKQTTSWKNIAPLRVMLKSLKKNSKEENEIQYQIKLLKNSGLFDVAWYSASNKDVVDAGCDPVEHYIRYGAAEGRDPSPIFSTKGYLERNLDVVETGVNPLVHYVKYGKSEKRKIGKAE